MKNRMSKTAIVAMSVFTGLAGIVQAALITDNFNRDNTAVADSSTSPNPIGTQYQIVSGTWQIGGNSYLQASDPGIMIDTSVALTNAFTLNIRALHSNYATNQSARQAGIVLNYQNATNYYIIRWGNESDGALGNIQIVKTVNGSNSQIDRITGLNMEGNTFYDWTFSTSETENEILYSVSAIGSETPIYSGSFTDSTYSGGYFGFYRVGSSGTVRFDDYSLNVIPEPQALLLLGSGTLTLLALRRHLR